MSRLTEKYNDNYVTKGYFGNTDIMKDTYNAIQKLGKLEDLEEQIGCSFDVVIKALKQDYIFTKSGKHSRLEFGTYGFEWCICYELRTQIRVTDYKKTWWLKEDRSE